MKKLIIPAICAAVLTVFGCKGTDAETTSTGTETESLENAGQSVVVDETSRPNVVQTAAQSEDHTTLVTAVKAADLVNALSSTGPFTVFAPTNAAFEKLLSDLDITAGDLLNHPAHEEQGGLDGDLVEDEEQGPGHTGDGVDRQAEDHVADLTDDVEAEDPLDVVLHDGEHGADEERDDGEGPQDGLPVELVVAEERDEDPEQSGEPGRLRGDGQHRGDRHGRTGVGVRCPEVERDRGDLEGEADDGEHDREDDADHQNDTNIDTSIKLRQLEAEYVQGQWFAVVQRDPTA